MKQWEKTLQLSESCFALGPGGMWGVLLGSQWPTHWHLLFLAYAAITVAGFVIRRRAWRQEDEDAFDDF
jgi:hypothetical protein